MQNTINSSYVKGLAFEEILILLDAQKDKFNTIVNLIESKSIVPGTVFTSYSIKEISTFINENTILAVECLNVLDILRLYSFNYYGNSSIVIDSIVDTIVSNRTSSHEAKVLYKDFSSEFYFDSRENFIEFIRNNSLFISIYMVSVVLFLLS